MILDGCITRPLGYNRVKGNLEDGHLSFQVEIGRITKYQTQQIFKE